MNRLPIRRTVVALLLGTILVLLAGLAAFNYREPTGPAAFRQAVIDKFDAEGVASSDEDWQVTLAAGRAICVDGDAPEQPGEWLGEPSSEAYGTFRALAVKRLCPERADDLL